MLYYVYVLYSRTLGRFYTGLSRSPDGRLADHRGQKAGWTSQVDDWEEVLRITAGSREEARKLEKRIKRRGAGRFLRDRGNSNRS